MTHESITPEEAQRHLEEERRRKSITHVSFQSMEQKMEQLRQSILNPSPEEIKRREANQKYEEERKAAQKEAESVRLMQNAHMPLRHMQVGVDWTNPKYSEWKKAYDKLMAAKTTGFLMGLTGTRGNGKTQLAVELCKAYCVAGLSALFITAMEFFIDIKSTFRNEEDRTQKDALDEYARYKLLVVDEVGVRAETDWENQLLFELLNRRYNSKMDTLLISNHNRADFIKSIGCSLASRMNETGGIIECNWESFRR